MVSRWHLVKTPRSHRGQVYRWWKLSARRESCEMDMQAHPSIEKCHSIHCGLFFVLQRRHRLERSPRSLWMSTIALYGLVEVEGNWRGEGRDMRHELPFESSSLSLSFSPVLERSRYVQLSWRSVEHDAPAGVAREGEVVDGEGETRRDEMRHDTSSQSRARRRCCWLACARAPGLLDGRRCAQTSTTCHIRRCIGGVRWQARSRESQRLAR